MLTLAEANRAIAAALVSAQNMKMKIAVSVCDDEGRLVAFQRMDGIIVEGIPAAMGQEDEQFAKAGVEALESR